MRKKESGSNTEGLRIHEERSSLAEFTKRPLPTEEEVEEFEEFIEEESREEDIEESLNEIYQDEEGHMVDVQKLDIKQKRGFFFWFFSFIFISAAIGGGAFAAYKYIYLNGGSDATAVKLEIEGQNEITSGEDFFYTINYHNNSNVRMNDVKLDVKLPENFIMLEHSPATEAGDPIVWDIGSLPPYYNGIVRIKGKIIGKEKENSVLYATLRYVPENFSSVFKKEAAYSSIIKSTGIDFEFDSASSALINEKNELEIGFSAREKSFISSFRLSFEPQENIKILGLKYGDELKDKIVEARPGVWDIKDFGKEHQKIKVEFQFTSKISDSQKIKLNFEAGEVNSKGESAHYPLYQKEVEYEVMKSDLNLTMIINGSREGAGVNFGEKLNYSLVYNNKGDAAMKDVVIMVVLESKFLDWSKLESRIPGKEKGNTITWSKEELPALEIINMNQEGTIDFSINVSDVAKIETGAEYQIKSYARYSVGGREKSGSGEDSAIDEDNRSNTVINVINSDMRLKEELRYFNTDNVPVGTGPNPPRVGETSTYKVYWTITNNLHELKGLEVRTKLPEGVGWNGKERATVGNVYYDDAENEIIWSVGRLPVSVFQTNAEFSISVNPGEKDRNKIMVLVSGSKAVAEDGVTKESLQQETKAKTSKLDDDSIGKSGGIVE
jgi:hypothetical protein